MIAMAVGTVLALLTLGYVLYPLVKAGSPSEVNPAGLRCPECGALVEPDASFCSNCGSPLDLNPGKTGLGNRS